MKFEYVQMQAQIDPNLTITLYGEGDEPVSMLEMGAEGWELIQMLPPLGGYDHIAVFKRAIPEPMRDYARQMLESIARTNANNHLRGFSTAWSETAERMIAGAAAIRARNAANAAPEGLVG